MGDAFSGCVKLQSELNFSRTRPNIDPKRNTNTSKGHREVMALVEAVCAMPAKVPEKMKQDVIDVLGEIGFHHVVSITRFMGWLNYTMEALGMKIEGKIYPYAKYILENVLVDEDASKFDKQRASDATEDGTADHSTKGMLAWLKAQGKNFAEIGFMVPAVMKVGLLERKAFEGIPVNVEQMDEWVCNQCGALPLFTKHTKDPVLKRVLCFGVRNFFTSPTDSKWSAAEKHHFFYIFACGLNNIM